MEVQLNTQVIKEQRSKKLWSQEQLATACGLSLRTIQRVEKDGIVAGETARALASVFDLPIEQLLAPDAFEGYHHKQFGWSIVLFTVIIQALIISFVLPVVLRSNTPVVTALIALSSLLLIGIAAGYLFSSLTIAVTAGELRWFFGPGFRRNTESTVEILHCEVVKNKAWWGYGIRLIPDGIWLYNVSGTDAVEVTMKSGRRFRLGTDEPLYLQRAISQASKQAVTQATTKANVNLATVGQL